MWYRHVIDWVTVLNFLYFVRIIDFCDLYKRTVIYSVPRTFIYSVLLLYFNNINSDPLFLLFLSQAMWVPPFLFQPWPCHLSGHEESHSNGPI